MDPVLQNFVEPSTSAPIDLQEELDRVPEGARIMGLFSRPLAQILRARGHTVRGLPEEIEELQTYPMAVHATMLLDGCRVLFPELPVRMALRKLGRGATNVQHDSTIARMMLGAALSVGQTLSAVAKSFSICTSPGHAEVTHLESGQAVVRLTDVYLFLDSHQVGVFEGALRFRKVQGEVLIHKLSDTSADLLCRWTS